MHARSSRHTICRAAYLILKDSVQCDNEVFRYPQSQITCSVKEPSVRTQHETGAPLHESSAASKQLAVQCIDYLA
jgi:hypothetical protein